MGAVSRAGCPSGWCRSSCREHEMTSGRRTPRLSALTIALLLAAAGLTACSKQPPNAPKDKYASLTAAQIYDIATRQMQKKNYATARDTLQKALGHSDATPDLIAKVHLALADAYFYDGGLLNL